MLTVSSPHLTFSRFSGGLLLVPFPGHRLPLGTTSSLMADHVVLLISSAVIYFRAGPLDSTSHRSGRSELENP